MERSLLLLSETATAMPSNGCFRDETIRHVEWKLVLSRPFCLVNKMSTNFQFKAPHFSTFGKLLMSSLDQQNVLNSGVRSAT